MGCAVSRAEKVDVVALCRERKRSLKLAIKSRRALSYEHVKYVHSFLAVAAAIRLFVARHTSPSSPFLLKFHPLPSAQPMDILLSKSVLLQEKQLEQDEQTTTDQSIHSFDSQEVEKEEESFTDYEDKNENNEDEDDEAGPYYSDVMSTMPCPHEEYNWNSYNLFDGGKPKEVGGSSQNLNEENLREEGDVEGIQELDAQETETGDAQEALVADDDINETEFKIADLKGDINLCQEAIKDPMVMKNPERSRDLLNALKDVEDQFVMSFDSVKDATQMLATNNVHMQSSMKNVKDNSPKPEQAIKWPHSTSSLSSSCKSLLSLSSIKSSTWTVLEKESSESKGGAESESHLLTLEILYAWEKKLYKNVKGGESAEKIYEQERTKLRKKDESEVGMQKKTRSTIEDLYARILVAIHSSEIASKRIQNLRDEEFQPQLIELLQGLIKTWKIMLETHETQKEIMIEVKSFICPTYGKFRGKPHQQATLKLEVELRKWQLSFQEYVAAEKAYIKALHGWLSRFNIPEVEFYSRRVSFVPPCVASSPPLLRICNDWLTSLEKLPEKAVTSSMKNFTKVVRSLWVQQGRELQQKMKVDDLTRELDRRVLAYQKAENKLLEANESKQNANQNMLRHVNYLAEKASLLGKFRKKHDAEKNKHHSFMQETHQITLNGFQTGFSSVLESLAEFSKASLEMYNDLVSFSEKALG